MKKIRKLTWLFLVTMILSGIIIMGHERTSVQGSGDVYYISNASELVEFAKKVNSGNSYAGVHVILTNDIDMKDVLEFTPIGVYDGGNYFCGIFDGNGYTIQNLNIIGVGDDANLGLFGSLGGVICNLTMEDCYIQGGACGAFCSIAIDNEKAAIFNCAVKNVVVNASHTSIIGGQYYGREENCVIDGIGDVNSLNDNLKKLSLTIHNISMNRWISEDGVVALSSDKEDIPQEICLTLTGSYQGELHPYYLEAEDVYVFSMPVADWRGEGELCVSFPDSTQWREKISFPASTSLQKEKDGKVYGFRFVGSEGTKAVFLDTEGKWGKDVLDASKENELPGTIQVLDEKGSLNHIGRVERIRGRGNDSWKEDKKGYGFKLMEETNLLGFGMDKDFVLLPGYRDASLMAYKVTWDLCKELDWEYALEGELVQLYINGDYQGLYFLSEKIEAGPDRISIKENKKVSSGYVFELDNIDYESEFQYFTTDLNNTYVVKNPAIATAEQMEYCRQLWTEFEEALYSEDGINAKGKHFTEYVDLETLATQWLFYEFNGEYSVSSSVYFYMREGNDRKIYALYPWDVEHSFVSDEKAKEPMMMTTGSGESNRLWVVMASHEEFREEVRRCWKERFLPALEKLTDSDTFEEEYLKEHERASEMNELRWGEHHSLSQKMEGIGRWFEIRTAYLNENIETDEYFWEKELEFSE